MVDDNRHFLTSLKLIFESANIACKAYENPKAALEFLLNEYQEKPFTEKFLMPTEEEEADHRQIDINIRAIHREIYNPDRFKRFSLLLVDYAMPGMNGLSLCKQAPKSIKRILLTGEADEKLAIEAFNSKLIDKFIRKDISHFVDVVKIQF